MQWEWRLECCSPYENWSNYNQRFDLRVHGLLGVCTRFGHHTSYPAVFLSCFYIALQCIKLVLPIRSPNWSNLHQLRKKFLLCPSSFTYFHTSIFSICTTTKCRNEKKDLCISQRWLKGECRREYRENQMAEWWKMSENEAVLRCCSDYTFPIN